MTRSHKKLLAPVFKETLLEPTYKKPFLLRIVDYDKRLENEVCFGSVGFEDKMKKEDVLHLYSEYASNSDIVFYPYLEETIYCANPYKKDFYINLDYYFDYLEKAKVNELKAIAHALGAKHVKISLIKEKKRFIKSNAKLSKKLKDNNIDASIS